MKIIQKGKPYRKHKCTKCKTIYLYKFTTPMGLIYCPECRDFFDFHFLDRKISQEEYEKFLELESGNNE